MKRAIAAITAGLASVHVGRAGPAGAQPVALRFGQVPSTVRAAATRFVDPQYLRAAGVE